MSVGLTGGKPTALYDVTSGIAFGEVFEDSIEAEAFMDFVCDDGRDIRHPEVYTELRNTWNDKARAEWEAAHADFNDINWTKCGFCGCDMTDEPHRHGVCPTYEGGLDTNTPSLQDVPF